MRFDPSVAGELGYALEPDLTRLPAWKSVEEPLGKRLVEAAKKYILEEGPDTQVWSNIDTKHYHSFALARYQALYLVLQREPDFIATIPTEVWERLAAIVLVHGLLQLDGARDARNAEANRMLVRVVYQYAPVEIIAGILHLIDTEQWGCEHIYWNIICNVEDQWDTRLEQAILVKANDWELAPECTGSLLSILLAHGVVEARAVAESLLVLPLPSDEQDQARALAVANALILYTENSGWSVVWPAILSNNEFGHKLIAKIAYGPDWKAHQLAEDQLADLYIWLVHQYPPSQYSIHVQAEGGIVGAVDSIALWRDGLLQQFKERGTFEACHAIQRIAREAPDLDQTTLQWVLLEAQTLARQRTWVPYSPENILKVVNNDQLRLVQNGEQLLEVVIESLKRLDAAFRGETPAWRDVWDRIPVNNSEIAQSETSTSRGRRRPREYTYRPIDENEFSDYVKRYLQADLGSRGIIANREVVIRADERIDIRIDAVRRNVRPETDDILSVIIEVKGCWNRELSTAMQTQLVDRYLKDNFCQHGIYLIGWFNCDQWKSRDDYRRRNAPSKSIDEAQIQFDIQATGVSQHGIKVKALLLNAAIRATNTQQTPGTMRSLPRGPKRRFSKK